MIFFKKIITTEKEFNREAIWPRTFVLLEASEGSEELFFPHLCHKVLIVLWFNKLGEEAR